MNKRRLFFVGSWKILKKGKKRYRIRILSFETGEKALTNRNLFLGIPLLAEISGFPFAYIKRVYFRN